MLDLIRQHAQSTGVKIAFALIIIVFVFWGVTGTGQQSPGTIATVNGKPVLMKAFNDAMRNQAARMRAYNPQLSDEDMKAMGLPQQVLSFLVTAEMMEQEAARLGISVSDAELRHDILTEQTFAGENGRFDPERYQQAVASLGMTDVQYEQNRKRELLQSKLFDYVTMSAGLQPGEVGRLLAFRLEQRKAAYVLFASADYVAGVNPSEEEIRAYYDANQQRFAEPDRTALRYLELTPASVAASMEVTDEELAARADQGPSEFKVSQIFKSLPDGSSDEESAKIAEKMQAVLAELKAGGDFAALAERESEDPSAQRGGDTGWLFKDAVYPEVRSVLESLKVGELSDVVRFPNGLAIIRLDATSPDMSLPREAYLAEFRTIVQEDKARDHFSEVQNQAEEDLALGKSLEEIAARYGIEPSILPLTPRTALTEALGLRRTPAAGTFETPAGSLIQSLLDTEDGFVVAAVTEQVPAGVKPFDSVKDEIRETLVSQEALRRAYQAAQEALPGFTGGIPAAFANRVFHTEAFARSGEIVGLGPVPALTDALFAAKIGQWLDKPFEVPSGVVLAMTEEVIAPTPDQLQMAETLAGPQLLDAKRQELYTAFMYELQERSKVQLYHQELFQ